MLAAPERLSKGGRALVVESGNELVLSAARAWEIATKCALVKLTLPEPPLQDVMRLMTTSDVTPLPMYHRHALRVATLPMHHTDPFDRLPISQA